MKIKAKDIIKRKAGDVVPFEDVKKKKETMERVKEFHDSLVRSMETPADTSQDPRTYENAAQEALQQPLQNLMKDDQQPMNEMEQRLFWTARFAARKVAWAMLNTARSYHLPKEIIEHLRQVAAMYAPD